MQRRLLLAGKQVQPKPLPPYGTVPALTTDLVVAANKGELGPLIGREQELQRLIQMLCRRTKRNVLLVGKPGVGRRTLVNGLAQRMSEGNVPLGLLGRRVHRLDLNPDGAVDRSIWRYTVSVRLSETVDECVASDAILFIDQLHKYFRPDEAAVEAAARLKLAVTRANLQVIGSTTPSQYDQFVKPETERDWSLQLLQISEPSLEETLAILRSVKSKYEQYHHVVLTEQALQAAIHLAAHYVPDRVLPEKAIDLLDEAGSHAQLRTPGELQAAFLALKQVRQQKQDALEAEEIDEAITLRRREVELAAQLDELRAAKDKDRWPQVTREDMAEVVGLWTGLAASRILEEEDRTASEEEPPDPPAVP